MTSMVHGQQWDRIDVTTFGGPPQSISSMPGTAALLAMAKAAYVRDDLTIEAFEQTTAAILAGHPVTIVAADGPEWVIPL